MRAQPIRIICKGQKRRQMRVFQLHHFWIGFKGLDLFSGFKGKPTKTPIQSLKTEPCISLKVHPGSSIQPPRLPAMGPYGFFESPHKLVIAYLNSLTPQQKHVLCLCPTLTPLSSPFDGESLCEDKLVLKLAFICFLLFKQKNSARLWPWYPKTGTFTMVG